MLCRRATGRKSGGQYGARLSGAAYIVLAAVLWGLLGPVARIALDAGLDAVTIAAVRALVAGAFFSVQARITRTPAIARKDWRAVAALGIGGVGVFYMAYMFSVREGGPALAAILLYTAPVWVAIGAWLWLGERITLRMGIAILMTLIGVLFVAIGGSSRVELGFAALAWGLLSGATYAMYYLLGRPLFTAYSTERVLAVAMFIGATILLPFTSFSSLVANVTWASGIALLSMSVVSTWLAYLIYAAGLRRIAAARAATIATIEPVVAMVVAYAIWGEALRPLGLAGAAIVLTGVVVATTGARQTAQ